jgi:uncharacterized protein YgbK (DUF1537 family)
MEQIGWASRNGFAAVSLDPAALDAPGSLAAMIQHLRNGRHVVAFTHERRSIANARADELGTALGRLAGEALAATGVKRLVIAGGDTSSHAGRALAIESLEFIAPLTPGAPLCRATAPGSPVDGLEVIFKGGQVGATDFFATAAHGFV